MTLLHFSKSAILLCMLSDLTHQSPKAHHIASHWKLRTCTLQFGDLPKLMGIVNVTPDSFSDGGKYFDTPSAVDHALKLANDGADILDIGGESTRPYAESVAELDELRRVIPVVQAVRERSSIPISIDTSKAKVAREALAAGAEIVNDVTGLEGDDQMLSVVQETMPGVCVMHMQGTPQTMQDNPTYKNVIAEILEYLRGRRDFLTEQGIDQAQICLDPGVGFGKTHEHNIEIMSKCSSFHELACPILIGHSRKGFLAKIIGDKDCDRTAATIGSAISLVRQGIQIIRVHDVLPARQALQCAYACGAFR